MATSGKIFRLLTADAGKGFFVYKITNLVNGKFYLGKCSGWISSRMVVHERDAAHRTDMAIGSAIRKFGADAFFVTIVARCASHQDAYDAESKLITLLRPEYNIGKRAPPDWEKTKTPEFCENMSRIKRANPSRPWLGKKRSDETKRKISETKTGRSPPPSQQSLAALRANAWKQWQRLSVPVICVETGEKFDSAAAASRKIGCLRTSVNKVVDKPNRAVFGLHFVRAVS